jgi:hypothetical protein
MNSLQRLEHELRSHKYCIYELNGHDIQDAHSFFHKIKEILPLDPPLSGNVHWDAFRDSVRGGIDRLCESKVAVVWTSVENMLGQGLADLCLATQYFGEVSSDVLVSTKGTEQPVRLITFLVGVGNNFDELEI